MENQKKSSIGEKQNFVQEPATEYRSKSKTSSDDEFSGLLEKLIEKGIAQCEIGETTPHAQVIAEMKIKHNLKF